MDAQVDIREIPFKNDWWTSFVSETNHFKGHTVKKDVFDLYQIAELKELVADTIRIITKDSLRIDNTGARIWLDGKYDENANKFFQDHPIEDNQSVENWAEQTFQDGKKFGMFINFVTRHNENLANKVNELIDPYLSQFGIPLEGISATLILGNYGWTPLGIHNDKRGEYIVHLHLGPGEKDMYIWEEENAKKKGFIHRRKVENKDDYMNDYDAKYTFGTGDIFSMPGRCVHIGNTKDFSIGLVLEFNGYTSKSFSKKMWFDIGKTLMDKNFEGDKALVLPAYEEDDHEKYINYLMEHLKYTTTDTKADIQKHLVKCFTDYKLGLLSNGGYVRAPYIDKVQVKKDYLVQKDKPVIKLVESYNLQYYKNKNKLVVFVRKNRFSVDYRHEYVDLLEKLNNKELVTVGDEYKTVEFSKFIELLFVNKGICFEDQK
ncbi:hypothetical protein ACJRPK_15265 [Aquimarina sp. 2-A2]|uniref:hypothetical protein n=1 Tax=Aquimarina sp. 2-A2 TaxID=3382644 RepID=UPI00387F28FC